MCPNPKNTLGGEKTSRKSRSVEERCLHYDLVKTKPTFKFHNGPDVFEHCDLNDEHDFENDYDEDHHFKDCLTKQQIDHLWTTGHCHDTDTTQPFVAPDGLLICKAGKCNATRADGSNHTVEDGSRCDNNRDCCERSSCSSKFFGKQDKICLHDDDHDDDAVIVNAHREGCGHEYQYCDKDADCCSPNGCHKPSAYRGFTESGYSGYSNQCGGIALRLALRDSGAAVPQTARFGDAEGGCGLDGAFCQPYGRYGPKGMPLGRDGGCCVDYYCDVQYGPDAPPGYEPAYPGIEPYPLHWDRPIGSPGTCKLLDDWTTGWTTGWHDPT